MRLHEIKTSEFPQANFNLDMFWASLLKILRFAVLNQCDVILLLAPPKKWIQDVFRCAPAKVRDDQEIALAVGSLKFDQILKATAMNFIEFLSMLDPFAGFVYVNIIKPYQTNVIFWGGT